MTTTTGVLSAVPEFSGSQDLRAISEAARSASLAANVAGARRLAAADRMVAQFAGREECGGVEGGTEGSGAADGRRVRPEYARLNPEARARDHLAAACRLTTWHAGRLVTAGVQIHRRLPHLLAIVGEGLMPEQLAVDLACRLATVPDEIVAAVESAVVAKLRVDLEGGDRPSRSVLESMVDAAIEDADPQAAQDAVDAAAEERTVRIRPARNGMASLWAKLPVGDAEMLRRRIENDANLAADLGSPRSMDQLRADALSALAVYRPTVSGEGEGGGGGGCSCSGAAEAEDADCGGEREGGDAEGGDAAGEIELGDVTVGIDMPRPTVGNAAAAAGQPIRISVIASAAKGLPNRVEFVRGAYTSFDWLCQELLEGDDATVRFEIIDPTPGALDDPEQALRYVVPSALAERIRLRDGTCRHPGCSVDARDCEIDHVIAFNRAEPGLGGPTLEWNLVCLCRKHHREKTFGGGAYRLGALGELIVTTETGHEHRTRPKGPLAMVRSEIQAQGLLEMMRRLISGDGYLTNPPGTERGTWTA